MDEPVRTIMLGEGDALERVVHDTIRKEKQCIVFVNTRKRAESIAERLAKTLPVQASLGLLADEILHVLSPPTKQCERLARVVKHGIAFHHAGLAPLQKSLIENAFRDKQLSCIVATPTLAAGVDLPAFRVIILDATRYADGWNQPISLLEYHQMSGRAGRPAYDTHGEAYLVARSEEHAEALYEAFFTHPVEAVQSKLGVQPVLRSILLGLLSMGVSTRSAIERILSKTLYARQYQASLSGMINTVLRELEAYGFLTRTGAEDFAPADTLGEETYRLTRLGKRVAELYIDPLTAGVFLKHLRNVRTAWQAVLLISLATEHRPLPSVRRKEEDTLYEMLSEADEALLQDADDPLRVVKLARILHDWMDEASEEALYEAYGITPGELAQRRSMTDWLAYSLAELARLQGGDARFYQKLRMRLQHGVREDVLSLVMLPGIGRKRARMLARHGIRTREDLIAKRSEAEKLLGERIVTRALAHEKHEHGEGERQARLTGWNKA